MTDQLEGEAPRPHGRPRPAEVVQRDDQVLAYLEQQRDETGGYVGRTRKEIAEGSGVDESKIYLSLYRLGHDGKIFRGEGHKWAVKTD